MLPRVADLERENTEQRARNSELQARIAELEVELKHRGKKYRHKANANKQTKKTPDLRKTPHRKHSGSFREPPVPDENTIHHDVRLECCPHCGDDLEETDRFEDLCGDCPSNIGSPDCLPHPEARAVV